MGFALAGVLCACAAAASAVLVAGALLRLAVTLSNRVAGPAPARTGAPQGGIPEWDWDDWDDEFAPARKRRAAGPIPHPGMVKACAITFVTAVVFALGFVLTGFAVEEIGMRMWRGDTKAAVALVNLPVAALAMAVQLVLMLPTTFWRAAMVTFVFGLALFALAALVGCVMFAAAVVVR